MATSEHISQPAQDEYHPRPAPTKKAMPSVSISQATLASVMMMVTDVLAVILALWLASVLRFYAAFGDWVSGQPTGWPEVFLPINRGYLLLFIGSLLIFNRSDGLYGPLQMRSCWHEQRRTIQACFASGLLLCGCMYVMHNAIVSRAFVAYLIGLTTLFLCMLRIFWRTFQRRRYQRGLDTKNVLILGAGRLGNVIRMQITKYGHLGRSFKGFLQIADRGSNYEAGEFMIGDLEQLERIARQYFIDEIIIAEPCSTATVMGLIEMARELDMEVLAIPGFYDDLTPGASIEYLGDFPVVSLHHRNGKVIAHLLKRLWDVTVSAIVVVALLPILLTIAVIIKVDSPGPVFYVSQRIGKKGRSFPCFKFRTMVANADRLKCSLFTQNERNGVLFKITNDPRITRVGRFLRKFSLDELPQLLNVIRGDMSLVGPRPPLQSEVELYELQHLRRLEVLPGLTGLWQIRARQDPSFERYVALDLAYVENWSLWMDLKILAQTAEVVLRGTGS